MGYETLIVEKHRNVTKVTLNRPGKLNALNVQMLMELRQLLNELREDVTSRFVIFTGSGRAFSSGVDLTDPAITMEGSSPPPHVRGRLGQLLGHDLLRFLENLEQITFAAVNGFALGGGLSLAMACDFRIASEKAIFGVPEAAVGIFFTWGCTPRLMSLVGPAKTKELIMTCDTINAHEALSIGLVNKVVPHDELMKATHEFIQKIGNVSPLAIRITKKIVNAASAPNFGDLYICEPELVERIYLSQDPKEGMNAFREKRKPKFAET